MDVRDEKVAPEWLSTHGWMVLNESCRSRENIIALMEVFRRLCFSRLSSEVLRSPVTQTALGLCLSFKSTSLFDRASIMPTLLSMGALGER